MPPLSRLKALEKHFSPSSRTMSQDDYEQECRRLSISPDASLREVVSLGFVPFRLPDGGWKPASHAAPQAPHEIQSSIHARLSAEREEAHAILTVLEELDDHEFSKVLELHRAGASWAETKEILRRGIL